MKYLLKAAFENKKYYPLLFLAVVMMWLATIAGQMEMISLGVLTNKGVNFFELFAQKKGDKFAVAEIVTKDEMQQRWKEIDTKKTGTITHNDAEKYLYKRDSGSFFQKAFIKLDSVFNLSKDVTNLIWLLTLVAFFNAVTSFANKYLAQYVAVKSSRDLRQKYFEHIQKLSMSFYHEYNIGSLSSRVVGDAGQIASAINSLLVNYVRTPFTVLSSLALCFYISWDLSLIIFFGLPLIAFPMIYIARKVKRLSKRLLRNQEAFASVLIDFLSGIHTVKIFAMEDFSRKKYTEQNDHMAELEEKSARYFFAARPIIHMIGSLFIVVIILYALYGLHMTIPEILVYCGILHLLYEPIKKFAEENNAIQRGVAGAERMYEVLNIEPHIDDHDGAIVMDKMSQSIEFDDVWFKYADDWVLKGVSFTIKKGEFVALVGPTGAGKSTVAQLLPRLYDVQKGEIRIDGRPLSAYTQKSLRENISSVPQKSFLFCDTVAENITFGRDFPKEHIEDAARRAHADEFIQALPKKYDTMLAEAGKNLSGGQQQRLAIARALVKNAPIMVMDEPTSALDSVSEGRIKMAMRELQGDMTQILIAHRLSTIEFADKIIYLEAGKKIAEGTKDELLRTCPAFKLMWEMAHHPEDNRE
jgi:ABC-type multidrug transport system fused ATPase/permease subunit